MSCDSYLKLQEKIQNTTLFLHKPAKTKFELYIVWTYNTLVNVYETHIY